MTKDMPVSLRANLGFTANTFEPFGTMTDRDSAIANHLVSFQNRARSPSEQSPISLTQGPVDLQCVQKDFRYILQGTTALKLWDVTIVHQPLTISQENPILSVKT